MKTLLICGQKVFYIVLFIIFVFCPLLLGESVDDCGGGYSESIAEMCDELNSLTTNAVPALSNNDSMGASCAGGGVGAILIATPNGREESGTSRDCLLLNPSLSSQAHINQFK